jgi:hypothetical protein
MKTRFVEWKHLNCNDRTCECCSETGATLREVVQELNTKCGGGSTEFRYAEVRLPAERVAESNVILVDGAPLESFIPGATVAQTECASCADLLGHAAQCRAIVADGVTYKAIPAKVIREALCNAAQCCTADCGCGCGCK